MSIAFVLFIITIGHATPPASDAECAAMVTARESAYIRIFRHGLQSDALSISDLEKALASPIPFDPLENRTLDSASSSLKRAFERLKIVAQLDWTADQAALRKILQEYVTSAGDVEHAKIETKPLLVPKLIDRISATSPQNLSWWKTQDGREVLTFRARTAAPQSSQGLISFYAFAPKSAESVVTGKLLNGIAVDDAYLSDFEANNMSLPRGLLDPAEKGVSDQITTSDGRHIVVSADYAILGGRTTLTAFEVTTTPSGQLRGVSRLARVRRDPLQTHMEMAADSAGRIWIALSDSARGLGEFFELFCLDGKSLKRVTRIAKDPVSGVTPKLTALADGRVLLVAPRFSNRNLLQYTINIWEVSGPEPVLIASYENLLGSTIKPHFAWWIDRTGESLLVASDKIRMEVLAPLSEAHKPKFTINRPGAPLHHFVVPFEDAFGEILIATLEDGKHSIVDSAGQLIELSKHANRRAQEPAWLKSQTGQTLLAVPVEDGVEIYEIWNAPSGKNFPAKSAAL